MDLVYKEDTVKALLIFSLFSTISFSQTSSPVPASQLSGTGTPIANNITCSINNNNNVSYIQLDSANGRLWLCDQSTGSWAWDHLIAPIATALTPLVAPGNLLAGGCSTIATINIPTAILGTNAATGAPVYPNPPTGNPGYLNIAAWVSANGIVSYQACTIGTITTSPQFYIRILLF